MSGKHTDGDPMELKKLSTEPVFDERRTSMRFPREPGMDYAMIHRPESVAGTVEVADESLGGLAILVEDGRLFSVDEAVHIEYADTLFEAVVRHITGQPDGRTLVGLDCHPQP